MIKLPSSEISLWRQTVPPSHYPTVNENLKVDVAVVGGGLAGLTTAYLLVKAGLKTAVVEKDIIGSGTTGSTTGKVTSQHNLMYTDLADRLGIKTARVYGQAAEAGLAMVRQIIREQKIDCDWQNDNNFVYTTESARVKEFEKEAKVATSIGMPATFETSCPLPFGIEAAVKFANQGKLNAQKYVLGLASAIAASGSYIFENSQVTRIRGGKNAYIKANKVRIYAKNIVVATNVPTLPLLARGTYCVSEYPHKSYLMAAPYKGSLRGMYISPDRREYSILPFKMGDDKYLLVGGENHIPGAGGLSSKHYKRLADYAVERFNVSSVAYKWAARDYIAYDGIPLVGKLYPRSKGVYVATAFKKWGLVNGTVAAIILRDLISGQKNDWDAVYDPHRPSVVASIPRAFLKEIKS